MSDTYRVWRLDDGDGEEGGRNVVVHEPWEPPPTGCIAVSRWTTVSIQYVVVRYAEWVHDQRDGCECTWPLTFRVRKPDGTTEDFSVEREYEPTFSASRIKVPA